MLALCVGATTYLCGTLGKSLALLCLRCPVYRAEMILVTVRHTLRTALGTKRSLISVGRYFYLLVNLVEVL